MSQMYKRIRERLRMSQAEVAVAAGVSVALVYNLEAGRVEWTAMQSRTRRGLAAAYGVDTVTGQPMPAQEASPASSQVA